MWQMVLANVSIKGWIIDSDIQGFFDGSCEVLVLSPHYVKIFYTDFVIRGVIMVKYGGWGLLMFFEPLSKGSGGFPYIFLITLHPVTFVPVDDSTLFHDRIFVLGSHQEAFDGIASFEVYLHSIFLTCSLEAFTQPFIIWHHYVILFLVASHAALVFLLVFMGWCFHSYLYPVECLNRVFTFCQDFFQVLLFLLQ